MRIPRATYRLQFHPGFGFRDAETILDYLSALGISDLYASPIFRARRGSTHGYDVVDPTGLNTELGGEEDFHRLTDEVRRRGMGWLQDVVPNHMAFDAENPFLVDVLENGEQSRYRDFFDIEWSPPQESMRGRILAPFLGSFYGNALEAGEIRLSYGEEGFHVEYYDLRFPLAMESYLELLSPQLPGLRRDLGEDHPDCIKFMGILYVLRTVPAVSEVEERYGQIHFLKRILWDLYRGNDRVRAAVNAAVRSLNGRPGEPESFNLLDQLLAMQRFRLCFWKVANEEINYRRFFTINDLISLRTEREQVFRQTHAWVLDQVCDGRITGLRIDHIDGLYDPGGYLRRLRREAHPTFLVVEKILEAEEEIPAAWPVQGTTGYEFLNWLNGVFIRTENERAFEKLYAGLVGSRRSYAELVYDKKKLILYRHMAGDTDNLAHLLKEILASYRHGSDITLYGLKRAVVEVLASFPVYRTYAGEDRRAEDQAYIEGALAGAREQYPNLVNELEFLEDFLLLRFPEWLAEEERDKWILFVRRFQQYSGPLMAKGFEDTVLYVYNRLLSLNEVGGSPDRFGRSSSEFHAFLKRRRESHPHALNATATHDTKRGEDVRARLNVLSEIPQEWGRAVREWRKLNARLKSRRGNRRIPDANDEVFLYQTLLGAWPFQQEEVPGFRDRLRDYLVKAVREAKVHTAWIKPDSEYEEAYLAFADEILAPSSPFLREFLPFQKRVARHGLLNSLAQVLIKATAPGVPDFYQGSELWDLNLVDPDNRRPVDYPRRAALARSLQERFGADRGQLLSDLLNHPEDGAVKLFLTWRVLEARGRREALFRDGDYIPLAAEGPSAERLLAFARRRNDGWAVTVAPRFTWEVCGEERFPLGQEAWQDTRLVLPEESPSLWRDTVSGVELAADGCLAVSHVFSCFPVALLLAATDS